jgi:hypothetical protein
MKKKIILIGLIGIAFSITDISILANYYNWTKICNVDSIMRSSPLYIPPDDTWRDKEFRLTGNAVMYNKGNTVVLIGPAHHVGNTADVTIFVSKDKGKTWNFEFNEKISYPQYNNDFYNGNYENNKWDKSFLISEDKLIIPLDGGVIFSNLSGKSELIVYEDYVIDNPAHDLDTFFLKVTAVSEDETIYNTFYRWVIYDLGINLRYTIKYTSDTGKTWNEYIPYDNNVTNEIKQIIPSINSYSSSSPLSALLYTKINTDDRWYFNSYIYWRQKNSSNYNVPDAILPYKTQGKGTDLKFGDAYNRELIHFIDANNGWLIGWSKYKRVPGIWYELWISYISVYRTTDGGVSWNLLNDSILSLEDPIRISFAEDGLHGVLQTVTVANDSATVELLQDLCPLYLTNDGGRTWFIDSLQQPYDPYHEARAACQTSPTTVVFYSSMGDIYFGERSGSVKTPEQLSSLQIYPNPASESTTISLELEKSCNMRIVLSNVLGQELIQVYDGFATEGIFTKKINTEHLAKGVYFLKVLIGGNFTIEKIVIN